MSLKRTLKTCQSGHSFYKSSDCPVCPICEENRKSKDGFLAQLAAPARRALENNGISSPEQLAKFSEKEILAFHGMGAGSIPKLRAALKGIGLSFKKPTSAEASVDKRITMKKPATTDEYLDAYSGNVLKKLLQMRATILKAAPKSEEVISYGMPAFKQNKVLVFFAAGKEHIGFYPTPEPIEAFKAELKNYKTSKGAIQFPLDEPLPTALITKIVKYRIKQDKEVVQKKK